MNSLARRTWQRTISPEVWRDWIGTPPEYRGAETHITSTVEWLKRAVVATENRGVAAHYTIGVGWGSGYPETTGYIIPTLSKVGDRLNDPTLHSLAISLADWLLTTQLPSGGFPGGEVRLALEETVFNTGQILRGLLTAWKLSGHDRFRRAAVAAADWLVSVQSEDGAWRKFTSPLTSTKEHAYDVLTASALLDAGRMLAAPEYEKSALRNYDWTLTRREANGFLLGARFETDLPPLTHSLAYVVEGLLEISLATGDKRGTDTGAEFLAKIQHRYATCKYLPGRLREDFSSAVSWSCVPGNLQLGWLAMRIGKETSSESLRSWGGGLVKASAATQRIQTHDLNLSGAVFGSYPLYGRYFPFSALNWGAKYLLDALLSSSEF